MNQTDSNASTISSKEDKTIGTLTLLVICFVFTLCYLVHYLRCRRIGSITSTPKPPSVEIEWRHRVHPVLFHCTNRRVATANDVSSLQSDAQWIQGHLRRTYGMFEGGVARVEMPANVLFKLVAVSMPAKNFRCGTAPNEFIPCDGARGFFHYQMISSGIQVTWFTVHGKTYTAGVCVYAGHCSPSHRVKWAFAQSVYEPVGSTTKAVQKRWCSWRCDWVIVTRSEYGDVRKFRYDERTDDMNPVQCSECCGLSANDDEECAPRAAWKRVPEGLEHLQVEFCPIAKKPVMIGRSPEGVIVHFNWSQGTFKMESCERCGSLEGTSQGADEQLPEYKYLGLLD